MSVLHVILAWFRPGSRSLKLLQVTRCKLNKKGYPLSVHRSPIVSEDRFRRVAPKFLVSELGTLFLVSKSGKVRVEERERDRGESSRLLVSAANVSTVLFLDGLIGERILVLGRLKEDRSSSVQRNFWRTAELQGKIPCRPITG